MKKTLTFTLLLLITASVWAGKPNKGNGGNNNPGGNTGVITEFEAADVTLGDAATDAISSDGFGTYQSGVDGVEAHCEYNKRRMTTSSATRGLLVDLGTCISGDDSELSMPAAGLAPSMNIGIGGYGLFEKEVDFPAAGQTITSDATHPYTITFHFFINGETYAATTSDSTGKMSITAIDLNNDGDVDQNVFSLAPSTWRLYKVYTYYVEVGKGKNKTLEERTGANLVAEYDGGGISNITFDLLGFRISELPLPW